MEVPQFEAIGEFLMFSKGYRWYQLRLMKSLHRWKWQPDPKRATRCPLWLHHHLQQDGHLHHSQGLFLLLLHPQPGEGRYHTTWDPRQFLRCSCNIFSHCRMTSSSHSDLMWGWGPAKAFGRHSPFRLCVLVQNGLTEKSSVRRTTWRSGTKQKHLGFFFQQEKKVP